MASANDALRFLLELCVLVSLAVWGFRTGGVMGWVLGIGAPLLAAVVWALFVTPAGSLAVGDPWRLVLETAIFGAGVAALAAMGRVSLALVLAVVAVLHLALTSPLDQR